MIKIQRMKGITLISLVVSIIILMILAGISISMLTGDNGIINKAIQAKEQTNIAEKEEQTTIDNLMDTIDEYVGIDWEYAKNNTTKHPEQKNSNVIAIGTNGKAVNMDLWEYTKLEDGTYGLNDQESLSENGNRTTGYNTSYLKDGKIEGTIPEYIKSNEDKEFIPVTNINYLFFKTELTEAPVIPSTIKSMQGTFNSTPIEKMPVIPNCVENMYGTFANCKNLKETTSIPDSVTNMGGTFNGCDALEKAPKLSQNATNMYITFRDCISLKEAPMIPDSVVNMQETFYNCVSLKKAPVIPNKVENMLWTFAYCTNLESATTIPSSVTILCATFRDCSNLQGSLEINANVTGKQLGAEYFNFMDYIHCLYRATTNENIKLEITGTCPVLDEIIESANNSNIINGNK